MIYINIGSNLNSLKGDKLYNLNKAIELIILERIKGTKNQPRTCDIDIIDYENRIINTNDIIIPHPRAHLRNFVLYPLNEISPKWTHPITNKKIDFLIKKLNFKLRNEITKIKESVTILT
jgi:7,8-dihydro-6-hydroxymethylpterin-pyrophosphokinase